MKYYNKKQILEMTTLSEDAVKKRMYGPNWKKWGVKIRNGQKVVSAYMFGRYWMNKMSGGDTRMPLEKRLELWRKQGKF